MSVNPEIKKIFPEKTDDDIIYQTYNPCEHCDRYIDIDCDNDCVLGRLLLDRLWKIVKDNEEKKGNKKDDSNLNK